MSNRSVKTIERYIGTYNKLQARNIPLSSVGKLSYKEFQKKTGLKSESQFRLARSIARHKDLQTDINQYLKGKSIPRSIIKPITVKVYMPKRVSVKTTTSFSRFSKKSDKFSKIKGKSFSDSYNVKDFGVRAKDRLKDALGIADRERQSYTGKQIKITIKSEITPNKKLDPAFREVQERTFQTKVRMNKDDLGYDIDDLFDSIDSYIVDYDPDGSVSISVSVVNYTI